MKAKLLLFVCFSVALGITAFRLQGRSEPMLSVDPDSLSFGDVWEQEDFVHAVRLKNHTDRTLLLTDLQTSCNCASSANIPPEGIEISPSGFREVTLALDITRGVDDEWSHQRTFNATIVPLIQGFQPRISWTVGGAVKSVVQPSQQEINIPEDIVVNGRSVNVHTSVKCYAPATNLEVSLAPKFGKVKCEQRPNKGNKYDIVAAIVPAAEPGRHRADLKVTPFLMDGTPLPFVTIPIHFVTVSDITATPGVVSLGPVTVGDEVNFSITLASASATDFTIVDIVSEGFDCVIKRLGDNSDPASEYEFRVSAEMFSAGSCEGRLTFDVEHSSEGMHPPIQVNLVGYGILSALRN